MSLPAEGILVIRRITSALVVALATVAAVGFAAPAHASPAGSFVAQINADRASAGRAAFAHRADLAAIAVRHAQKMASSNSLHHNPNLTGQVTNWRAVGENVGMGGNVRILHAAFMKSPAHRANILDRDYSEVGIGVTTDSRGVMWVAEVFRQPMRAAVRTPARAVAGPATATAPNRSTSSTSPQSTTTARPATKRPAAKRPAPTKTPAVRWATRPAGGNTGTAGKSAWMNRLANAAGAQTASADGALPRAVNYLHVLAG